jgi:ABC-type dipeptide/oligopeptide/nickel transport system ATPase component
MKIIMLSGECNSGKSTTLNLVYNTINPAPQDIIEPKTSVGNQKDKDFKCIICYNGKKVSFYTGGDNPSSIIDEAIEEYKEKCDTLVCACRKEFKKKRKKNPYSEVEKYKYVIIGKQIANDEDNNWAKEVILKNIET